MAVAKPPGAEKLCNLYVANLELHLTKDDLFTIFHTYGTVLESKVLFDKATSASRGVGFVKYEHPAEADAAVKALNGVTLAGTSKPLTVRVAEKKDDKMSMPMGAGAGAAFGRNVRYNPMGFYPGYQMPPAGFQQGYGGGYPQQMGAPQHHQQHQVPMNPNMPTFCLFVFNLPPESDENYLYQLFGPYGAVAQVKIVRDPATNLCKGFGFVNMGKMEDAQSAIAALNGAQIGTKTLQVSFKKDK